MERKNTDSLHYETERLLNNLERVQARAERAETTLEKVDQ